MTYLNVIRKYWLRMMQKLGHTLSKMASNSKEKAGDEEYKQLSKKGFDENYGIFLKWGGSRFYWIGIPYLVISVGYIFLYMYTAYLKIDDIETMSESLHFVFLLANTVTGILTQIIYKKKLDNFFWASGKGFHDYEGTLKQDCQLKISKLRKTTKKSKGLYIKIYTFLLIMTAAAVSLARPVKDYLNEYDHYGKYDEKYDGILKEYIAIPCYYPFDTRKPRNIIFALFLQYSIIFTSPGVVLSMDGIFLSFCEEFLLQLDIIYATLRNCYNNADMLYNQKINKDMKNSEKELLMEQCIEICLKHSIKQHQHVIKVFKDFGIIYYYCLLEIICGISFMLCLAGLLFISNDVSLNSKVTFLFFLIAEIVHIFIYCWYGEQINYKSNHLIDALYNGQWINHSKTIKNYYLMLNMRCNKPLKLSAGGYMNASLQTLTNVLSSSYSYFNLLNMVHT